MISVKIRQIFQGADRSSKYKRNIGLLIIYQVLGIVANLMLVPITLHYLGVTEFGIWITLTTLITWFTFFDVGLGNGLRNKYAESKARNHVEDMKKYVSTAFFTMAAISCCLFIVFSIASGFIDWPAVLNAPKSFASDLNTLMIIVVGMFCIRLIANILNMLLTADQEPGVPALLGLLGQILSLISVFLVSKFTKSSILYIGITLSASQLFPLIIAFIYFFFTRYKFVSPSIRYFSKFHIRAIFSLGMRFFLIQITALVLFQSNNIIIAHVCGLKDVSQFNIAYRYINIIYVFFTAFLNPLWSASTEAYVKGEIEWITRSIKKLNQLWVFIIIGGLVMVLLSPIVYKLWLHNAILPNYGLLCLILIYFIFLARSTMYRSFMNGTGKISLQFYVTLAQSLLHIPLAIALGKYLGIAGIIITMICWVLINSIWEQLQFKRIINHTAIGIWGR